MSVGIKNKKLLSIVIVGLMAALVFVGNYMSIPIPNGVLLTRIHLGNSMCLLAGLLFGRLKGGLASGIGAGLYDLLTPQFVTSAPFTFFSKFCMGFVAGHIRKHGKDEKSAVIIGAVVGQLVYIALYLSKTFVTQCLLGQPMDVAMKTVGLNALTSAINGVLACVIAIPLYYALSKALDHTSMAPFIREKEEKKGWLNPLTAVLTAFAIAVTALYTINLSASKKLEAETEKKEAEYQRQIDELNTKVDALYAELGIAIPELTAEE